MHNDESLLANFFLPSKRERYLEMIANPKKRPRFIRELARLTALDPRYIIPLPAKKLFPRQIENILNAKGAPKTCWVTAENPALDAREMPLMEALNEVVGYGMGAFITCIPGRLAFYEGEAVGDRCVLERRN